MKEELEKESDKGAEDIAETTIFESQASVMKNKPIASELYHHYQTFKHDERERGSDLVGHDEGVERHIGQNVKQH